MVLVFCVSLQVNETESEDMDLQIFCVSCSHPINPKVAMRHMERCYAKVNRYRYFISVQNQIYLHLSLLFLQLHMYQVLQTFLCY